MYEDTPKTTKFRRQKIRLVAYGDEQWFVVNDVVKAITGSSDPSDYLKKMRKRDPELKMIFKGEVENEEIERVILPLRLEVKTNGGRQPMWCWNVEGIFRMIQAIPDSKAKPFRRWLVRAKKRLGL